MLINDCTQKQVDEVRNCRLSIECLNIPNILSKAAGSSAYIDNIYVQNVSSEYILENQIYFELSVNYNSFYFKAIGFINLTFKRWFGSVFECMK